MEYISVGAGPPKPRIGNRGDRKRPGLIALVHLADEAVCVKNAVLFVLAVFELGALVGTHPPLVQVIVEDSKTLVPICVGLAGRVAGGGSEDKLGPERHSIDRAGAGSALPDKCLEIVTTVCHIVNDIAAAGNRIVKRKPVAVIR